MKKSYHSMVVPIALAKATRRTSPRDSSRPLPLVISGPTWVSTEGMMLEPLPEHVEHLLAVVLEHREVSVAAYPAILQEDMLSQGTRLLRRIDDCGALLAIRVLRGDIKNRNAAQVR